MGQSLGLFDSKSSDIPLHEAASSKQKDGMINFK